MPFQGNPNAGQPDPALLNLLFQQKARREEMAYKQQQDAIANQMAAQAAAAKEARDAELHKLKVLEKRATLTDKLRSMASDVDSARRNAEQVTSKNFTKSDLLGGGGGEDFASIVAQNDPTTANQLDQSNAAQANLATQLSMGSELQQQLAPGIDRGTAVDATLGMGGAFEANRQRKAEIKAAEYDRQFGMHARKEAGAREDQARIAAEAPGRRAVETDRNIRRLSRRANRETDPANRADLLADLRAATSARDAEMLKNQPGEAIRFRETTLAAAEEYRRKDTALQMLGAIEKRPDVLGFRPNATQAIQNIVGTTSEILTFIAPSVNSLMQNPGISQEAKDRVEKLFVYHVNPDTGERLEESRLQEAAVKWILSMGVNESGRQTQKQIDEFAKLTNYSDPFVSVPVAIDRLRATRRTLQRDLDYVDRPGLEDRGIQFEKDGRILGDPSFSWGGSQPLSYEDLTGASSAQSVDPITGASIGSPNSPKNVQDPVQAAIDKRRQSGPQN